MKRPQTDPAEPPVPPLPSWLLALLRCPCCMSDLVPVSAGTALRCQECGRDYPLQASGAGLMAIPRLKRDDTLATLAQDVVVYQEDPDSTRADRRKLIAHIERRERFLAPLLRDISRPYAILAARPDWTPHAPGGAEVAAFDCFVGSLPRGGTILDLACGAGLWSERLAGQGFRIVGADSSGPSLARAAGDVALVEADMMEMPFASAALDGVWCSEAFEYVRPDRRTVFFRQVHRVLRPGGILYLSAETEPLGKVVRQYLLWRVVFGRPVLFWEYIYRLPREHGGGWHYHVMSSARTLHDLCRGHGFRVLALRRAGGLWLLLARKVG